MLWSIFMLLFDGSYTACLMPIVVAFFGSPCSTSWLHIMDWTAGAIYWTDIAAHFVIGFVIVNGGEKMPILDAGCVAWQYIRHGTFLWDVASAAPILVEAMVLFSFTEWYTRNICRFLPVGLLNIINLIYVALVGLNFLACVWLYIAMVEGAENSWLNGADRVYIHSSGPRQWIAAIYFSTMTITTVGFGDILPLSAAEQVVSSAMMLLGMVLLGILISASRDVLHFLAPDIHHTAQFRRKMLEIEPWARRFRVSVNSRRDIALYYSQIWLQGADSHQNGFFKELPSELRGNLAQELTAEVLESCGLAAVMDPNALTMLAQLMQPQVLETGHELCCQGNRANRIWILQSGRVQTLRCANVVQALAAPGILGGLAVASDALGCCSVWPVTIQATAPCALWEISTSGLRQVFHKCPHLRVAILQMALSQLNECLGCEPEMLWTTLHSKLEGHLSVEREKLQ